MLQIEKLISVLEDLSQKGNRIKATDKVINRGIADFRMKVIQMETSTSI